LEVKPPGFDFTSTFKQNISESEQGKILSARDLSGRELSPSADLTVQVVKGMTGFTERKGSSKVYYTGKIVKDSSKSDAGRREILQAGAEIIGHSSGNTFKMLLSLMDELLGRLGFQGKITVVLGNTRVISSIADRMKFNASERNELSRLLYSKNIPLLKEFLHEKSVKKEIILGLERLILSFDPHSAIPILEELSPKFKLGLEEIIEESKDIWKYVNTRLERTDLCLDYSLVRDMEYYTGFIFHGYAGKTSYPLLMGGAYDNLFEKFSGEPKRACGFALNIDIFEEISR
jgi:ATP phosphoribosyltransferase regulatory subunit